MHDKRHERALTALLTHLAREDERAGGLPADLEGRVLAAFDTPDTPAAGAPQARARVMTQPARLGGLRLDRLPVWRAPRRRRVGGMMAAGAAAALVLLVATLPRQPDPPAGPEQRPAPAEGEPAAPAAAAGMVATPRASVPAAPARGRRTGRPAPVEERSTEVVSFVPLVPIAEEELSGSFSLVRVELPAAALIDLGVALERGRSAQPVQAEVLLGEDGLARAIRVTGHPSWRVQ
jgi:hypothetical protein